MTTEDMRAGQAHMGYTYDTAAAALAQIEHIKSVIERSASHMQKSPANWGITGDMGAILARLHDVTA